MRLIVALCASVMMLAFQEFAIATDASVYTPVYTNDFNAEVDWKVNLWSPHKRISYVMTLKKIENVHAIYSIVEGIGRPCWYASLTPDSYVSQYGIDTNVPSNTKYWHVSQGTNYLQWTVPASGNGSDTLVVSIVGVTTGGTLDCIKNYGEANQVTVGTVSTVNGTTAYRLEKTVDFSGNELATGDTVRLTWTEGESADARVCGMWAYDSDGIAEVGDSFIVPTSNAVHSVTSGVEFAYAIAPIGSEPTFFGSYAHQGAVQREINVLESWTKDGEAWTPAAGWQSGLFTLNRTSDADWDGSPTVIASFNYTYTFSGTSYGCANLATASVNLVNTGSFYPAMFAAGTNSVVRVVTNLGQVIDATPVDDTNVYVDTPATTTGISMLSTPGGAKIVVGITDFSDAIYEAFLKRSDNHKKFYWRIIPSTDASDTWGGSWTVSFEKPNRTGILGSSVL